MPRPRVPRLLVALLLALSLAGVASVAASTPASAAPPGAGIDAGGQHIPNGGAVREENSYLIFLVVDGGKLWFQNADEFYGMGYTLESVRVVPVGALAGVPDKPREGALVRERYQYTVYYVSGGTLHWIPSLDVLAAAGFDMSQVNTVPNGSLGLIARGLAVSSADFRGEAEVNDGSDAHASSNSWEYQDTDTTHLESADGKARLVGGMKWWSGHPAGKGWVRRGQTYTGTKAYAPGPVGCIWAQINWGYPLGSLSFPPGASVSGASEVGEFFRSCRQGNETRPSPINLTGLSYAKAYLNSATLTVCTSNNAAEGPRFCSREKEIYLD